ncbi:MAG TPA: putative DNA-binding domain-containing protein [Usitatibacter sp.]|nr:putative DNA-binding domain-containing protein [Usitatibacter sp.]
MRLAAAQRAFMAMLRTPALPCDERLATYHAAARANWRKALCKAYPVVRRLVGDEFFAALAEAFAQSHPSMCGDLARYGEALPRFLEGFAPAAALGYLPDVARLEWAIHESRHAAEAQPFDLALLARVSPQHQARLRPRLHPAARLLRSTHPVVAIWEANQPDRDGKPGRFEADGYVLVARVQGRPLPSSVRESDWRVLACAAESRTLAQACEALADDAASLPEILARHAAAGVICAFDGPA